MIRWWIPAGYGLSIAVHIGLATGISSIPKQSGHRATTITAFDAKPKPKKEDKKEEKPKPPEPAKPLPVPQKVLKMASEPPPAPDNTPPPSSTPTPAGHAAMAALPDFGIALGGGAPGIGGMAVPVGTGGLGGDRTAGLGGGGEKKVKALAPKQTDASDPCTEDVVKPKPVEKAQAQYIGSAAQAAGIEGVIRVEATVDAEGSVTSVKVIEGSTPKLDELALAAAKRWKYSPATRCGKPVPGKYTTTYRFKLGD
jgi:protein TonB